MRYLTYAGFSPNQKYRGGDILPWVGGGGSHFIWYYYYLTREYYDWDKVAGFRKFRHIFPNRKFSRL